MILIMYALLLLTFICFVIWVIDQLFLLNFQKLQTGNVNKLITLVYQYLPYLMLLSIVSLVFMLRKGLSFDFNYILVPITLFFFAVVVADKLVYKDRKTKGKGKERSLINNAYDFLPILAFVVIMRSFIIEPFNIPSSSMVPTLYTGDFISVNKYAYGVRLPLTYQKVVEIGEPEHGDVMVFRYPDNPKVYYIKRAIGLPGDEVSYANGVLSINGKAIDTQALDYQVDDTLTDQLYTPGQMTDTEILTEVTAPQKGIAEEKNASYFIEKQGKHEHLVRYLHDVNAEKTVPNSQWKLTVPEGHYFVMGDNRDRSADSRYWGFVPEENLAGKATYIWMHKKPGLKDFFTFSRNGSID